ncbi:glycoside hydrolase family 3 N-terminal domain-containing protein [Balneolales bacterium ANBcel1]|nr:glycoside hydrolase family 3 N-terminal domain-containing protein [Balneolales bacterium ANBcel1]
MSTKNDASLRDAPYKNPSLSPEERTRDLLSRMTVEEKAAQMIGVWNDKAETLVDENGDFDLGKAKKAYGHGNGLGQVGRPNDAGGGKNAREQVELTNTIQKFFLENTRLGIPVFYHEECLHGLAAKDGTSFPQPIALAGTFNTELVEQLYAMAAEEARVRGTHQALTPVVDVAREPRWGRVEETFGEDPWLVAEMGKAAVRGFQGDASFNDKKHVVATLKHFAAHGEPEGGMNCAPVNVSERVLRDVFLYPFKEAIQKAGAISIMPSYNEIDGVPSHANKWLLRDVLRDEWGFKGFAVSDYYAIWEMTYRPDTHGHFVAAEKKDAAELAVNAGVNVELPEPDCYLSLVDLVKEGRIKESQLDELVEPLLYWKFKMGLFDDPYVDPEEAEKISGCEGNRDIALRAARESITLLKNEGNLLPLDPKKLKTIAVIGPNADRSLLGGYMGVPKYETTVYEGIRERVGDDIEVIYSKGCEITVDGDWNKDEVDLPDPEEDRRMIREAVRVAEQSDVVVLAIGGNEQTSRESWALNHMGDRTSLELFGRQNELVRAIVATGKPVVVFLFNGRPLSITELNDSVAGIFECWYIGQETGGAVADVLFGDYSPGGKLPISIPRSVGHIPSFYNHKPSARRGYLHDDVSALYPFGYGLSYTNFAIENVRLEDGTISKDGSTRVLADVTNTGGREGSEVVQMYVRDRISSVTRPVKELKGFRKVWLNPGETETVAINITRETLAFHNIDLQYVVEPGEFDIMVGSSSRDKDLSHVTLTVF